MVNPRSGFVDVMIEIILGDLALGGEPDIRKAFGVADALLKNANHVRPAADMGMN
jgi:hypothetical protein